MRGVLAVSALVLLTGTASAAGIVEAAKEGDWAAVRSLAAQKADVNAPAPDGATALHWAAHRADAEAAELLLQAGAKPDASTDLGVTPLWLACRNGSAGIVRLLLNAGADPNLSLLRGETPLMAAALTGSSETIERLLAKGANPNARGARGQTALMWAASRKHAGAVSALLAHRADPHARSETWSQMMAVPPHGYPEYNRQIPHGAYTALLFAVRAGDLATVKALTAGGANVNDADAWGVSATALAAHSGLRDIVEFLLSKGADPNASGAGFSALHAAIARRDTAMVAALLARGANANAPLRTWTPTRRSSKDFHFQPFLVGAPPLWMAARFLEPDVVRMLIKHGADARAVHEAEYVAETGYKKRKESTSALMAALGRGSGSPWTAIPERDRATLRYETAKALVDSGAELNGGALEAAGALGDPRIAALVSRKPRE